MCFGKDMKFFVFCHFSWYKIVQFMSCKYIFLAVVIVGSDPVLSCQSAK